GQEVRRVAEHVAHLHGEEADEPREGLRVVEDAVLQARERRAPEMDESRREAPLERRLRVAPEVVVVLLEDRVEQERQLDVGGRPGVHLGIHTLASDSSLSTSSGLAM